MALLGSAADFSIVVKLVDQMSGEMDKLSGRFSGLGDSLTSTGKKLTAGVTMPILGLGLASLKLATDFDKSMRNVNSILQLPEQQFDTLRQQVIEFSTTTRASATDVATSLYFIASAGYESEDAFKLMSASSRAAGAGLAETTDVARLLISALNAYGYSSDEATRVTDIFLQTVRTGITTLPELAGAMGRILPQASSLGVSMEEVGFSLAQLTRTGLSTDESVTRLNALFVDLLSPSKELQGAIEELGYASGFELVQATGGVLGAMRVLKEEGFVDTADEVASLFHNVRSMGGALGLLQDDATLAEGAVEAFGAAANNAVEQARAEQYKSLAANLGKLKSSMEALGIALGTLLIPFLTSVVEKIVPFIQNLGKANPALLKLALVIAGVLAAVGPLLIFLGMLVNAFGAIVGVLSGPLLPIIAAVAAAAGLLYLAWKNNVLGIQDFVKNLLSILPSFEDIKKAFQTLKETGDLKKALSGLIDPKVLETFDQVVTRIQQFVGAVQDAGLFSTEASEVIGAVFGDAAADKFKAFGEGFMKVWSKIREIFTKTMDQLRPIFDKFVEGVKKGFSNLGPLVEAFKKLWAALGPFILALLGVIGGAIAVVVGLIVGLFSGIANAIGPFIQTIVDVVTAIATILTGIIQVITGALQYIWGLITGNSDLMQASTEKMKEGLLNIWNGLVQGIIDLVTGLWTTIVALVTGIYEGVVEWFTMLWETLVGGSLIPDMVNSIIEWFTNLVDSVVNTIQGWVATLIGIVSGMVETILSSWQTFVDTLQTVWDTAWTEVGNLITAAKTTLTGILEEIISFFDEKWNSLKDTLTDVWQTAWDTIQSALNTAWTTLVQTVTTLIDDIKAAFNIDWASVGSGIVTGIASGIELMWDWLVGKAKALAQAAIDAAKGILNLKSPSKEFMKIGMGIAQGMGLGIEQGTPLAVAATRGMGSQVLHTLTTSRINNFGGNTYNFNNYSKETEALAWATIRSSSRRRLNASMGG